jgi:hypothetical protein
VRGSRRLAPGGLDEGLQDGAGILKVYGRALFAVGLLAFNPSVLIMPSDSFRWSLHAIFEARRRGIPLEIVERVVQHAQQVGTLSSSREVRQSIDETGALVRVIVDIQTDPPLIVTAYRTSKVAKYWRPSR